MVRINSLPKWLLIIYKEVTEFFIIILCPESFLEAFICSNNFLFVSVSSHMELCHQ